MEIDMAEKCTNISEYTFDHRLRHSDLKTRMQYAQCNARHTVALKGHPLYQDITLKLVSRYHNSVSSQGKETPC